VATALAVFATLAAALGTPASAGHSRWSTQPFPYMLMGFNSMSNRTSYSGTLWVNHNAAGCGAVEQNRTHEVWMNVHNSTRGQTYMTRWLTGVDMVNMGCAGSLSTNGMVFTYQSNAFDTAVGWDNNQINFDQGSGGGPYIGGRVQRIEAPSGFCAYYGSAYPCGSRSWIQINRTKWSAGTDTYKRREILHENGHAHGLIDCPNNIAPYYGMMMNGSCGWDESIIGWNADDRQSVSSIYP
jgi:hypothetical protein